MKIAFLFLVSVLVTYPVQSQESFPGIEELMSAEEFRAAGLDTLSDEQIQHLNEWLVRYTARDAKVIGQNNEAVRKEADREYRSRIVGEFSGWDGDTLFHLENGEVWQQRQTGKWRTKMENPEVLIYKNFFGYYNMKILETGRLIGVKRVK